MATIRESPNPASQADIVNITKGAMRGATESWLGHRLRPMKIVSIIPSRHKRAERRCMRWKDNPMSTMVNIIIKKKVIEILWI